MNKRYLTITGLIGSFAVGFNLNTILANKLITEADEKTEWPASLMLTDPDGNVILLDQHR